MAAKCIVVPSFFSILRLPADGRCVKSCTKFSFSTEVCLQMAAVRMDIAHYPGLLVGT